MSALAHVEGCHCPTCTTPDDGWKRNTVTIPVSAEMLDDWKAFRHAFEEFQARMLYDFEQHDIDQRDGPRLGPGRNEWHEITWPEYRSRIRRDNIRRNLADLLDTHHPKGFRR